MAVTGAQCLAACTLHPGTVAEGMAAIPDAQPAPVRIEHASRAIDVAVDYEDGPEGFTLKSAGLVRTARLLARGDVFVPRAVWAG